MPLWSCAYGIILGLKPSLYEGFVAQRRAALDEQTHRGLALDTFDVSNIGREQLTASHRVVWLGRALAAAVLVLSTGCASTSHPPAPVSVASDDYSYIIGAGDNLNIQVWRNPELSMSVPVRPDGKIAAPLVDEMVVQGKTSVQVAREVEKQLGKYVRDPVVTVIVTGFVGPYSEQIRVVGEATRPQFLPYKQKMTVLDVMIAVGGLTDFASGNSATILRTAEGNKQYSVRLKDLVKHGDVSANVEMRPGDILIIPQSLF